MGTTALTVAFAITAVVVVALAAAVALLYREVSGRRFESSTASSVAAALRDGRDEDAVQELLQYLEDAHERMERLADHARSLDEVLDRFRERSRAHLRRTGVVRFDASESVSGGLSCALCVLDADSNGFLVTTLYDLERSRTFVREVKKGRTDRELLDPEQEALEKASRAGEGPPTDA